MSSALPDPLPARRASAAVVVAGASAVAAIVATAWGGFGLLSLPGLAVLAALLAAAGWVVLTRAPWLPVALLPALIPLPLVGLLFPIEYLLIVIAFVLLVDLLRREPAMLGRLARWEAANLSFVAWALFTAFWCFDGAYLFLGVRRLLLGVVSAWVASRLAGRV